MPRRLIAGQRPDGTSTFIRAEEVEPRAGGSVELWKMWAWDEFPVLPYDGLEVADPSVLPPAGRGGMRALLLRYEAGYEGELHWHDTVELQWLVAGELIVRLDDGSEETMRPGDLLVQYGTNHAWTVRSPGGAVMATVMLSAERTALPPPQTDKLRLP